MKNRLKKQLFLNLPYLLVFYVGNKVSWLFRRIQLKNIGEKVLYVMNHMEFAFQPPFPSIYWKDIAIGIIAAVIFKGIVYMRGMDKKKYRRGVEYGSARWGTKEDIQPFVDKDFFNNLILTKSELLMISNRPKNPKYARNNNVAVIGGSGSGKTAFWLIPNLLQMHSSYVVTDPNGYNIPR